MEELDKKAVWPGWETVRLIGRGSFGAVYEIERDVFGHKEQAALKYITIPQNEEDIEELYDSGYDEASVTSSYKIHLESIVNEYSLMREMNGAANVVNCDDFRVVPHDDNIGYDIFIKMELLTPLTKALDKQPSEEQVIRIAKDMCNALILCKKYDIIHRDIKPQNIFVSRNGYYKLGDFGIAKTMEKTTGGTKIGTYRYMAPEVYNNEPYNLTVDIYSLGLVLHWLLNERRSPFMPLPPAPASASQEEDSRLKRYSGVPIPPPAHGSEDLKRIVLKACAYNPKDRYQSADEMLSDLERIPYADDLNRKSAVPDNGLEFEEEDEKNIHSESDDEEEGTVSAAHNSGTDTSEWLNEGLFEETIGRFNQNTGQGKDTGNNEKKKIWIIAGAAGLLLVIAAVVIILLIHNNKTGEPADSPAKEALFSDLEDPSQYYNDAIYWALENNITTAAGLFSPDEECTREMCVTYLWRAMGEPEPSYYTVFTDVDITAYYHKPVSWATEQGITVGLNDGTGRFGIGETCTREMFVTFLWRAAGKPEPQKESSFSDVVSGAYYEDAVSWAAETGITVGLNDGTDRFGVGQKCTLKMCLTFLYRYAQMNENNK